MNDKLHLCEHPGCDATDTTPCAVVACRSDGYPAWQLINEYGPLIGTRLSWHLWRRGRVELPPEWYCPEHAKQNGYCWGCGQFWSGCETFDFDPGILCPNCRENPEYDVDFHDDEWLDMWADYPHELLAADVEFEG
jgi:hypothetical protein